MIWNTFGEPDSIMKRKYCLNECKWYESEKGLKLEGWWEPSGLNFVLFSIMWNEDNTAVQFMINISRRSVVLKSPWIPEWSFTQSECEAFQELSASSSLLECSLVRLHYTTSTILLRGQCKNHCFFGEKQTMPNAYRHRCFVVVSLKTIFSNLSASNI